MHVHSSIHLNACSFSGSFPMLFTSAGQNIEASASASVLPMHIQDWFPLGLTCLIHILRLLKTFKQGVLILHWVPQIMCPVLTVRSLEMHTIENGFNPGLWCMSCRSGLMGNQWWVLHWGNFFFFCIGGILRSSLANQNLSFQLGMLMLHSFIHPPCLNCFKSFNILTHDTRINSIIK